MKTYLNNRHAILFLINLIIVIVITLKVKLDESVHIWELTLISFVISVIYFVIPYVAEHKFKNWIKVFNYLSLIVYILPTLVLIEYLRRHFYYIESLIFFLNFIISASVLFLYYKDQYNLLNKILMLIYYLIISFFATIQAFTGFDLQVFTTENSTLYTSIQYSLISIFIVMPLIYFIKKCHYSIKTIYYITIVSYFGGSFVLIFSHYLQVDTFINIITLIVSAGALFIVFALYKNY